MPPSGVLFGRIALLCHRGIHLVNWDILTLHKRSGGLGLRKARFRNVALLGKLVWNLLHDRVNCAFGRCKLSMLNNILCLRLEVGRMLLVVGRQL